MQVAVAAQQLQGVVGHVEARVGDEAFGHGRPFRGVVRLGVQFRGGGVEEDAGRLQRRLHVGETKLKRLELVERPAERLALACVGQRLVERRLCAAERAGGDVEPAAVEAGHGDRKARAFVRQQVVGRHPAVFEDDLAGRLHVPAHLVLDRAEGEAGRILGHYQRRDAFRAVLPGPRHHHIDVAVAGAGDELLGAVQHIVATVAHRPGFQRRGVRAGAWLGQAIAGQPFHRRQLRQETLALLLRSEAVDHRGRHVVDRDEGGKGRAGARQCLEHQNGVEASERGTADVVANIDAAETEWSGLADHVGRKPPLAVPVERVGRDAFGGECFGHGLDGALVLGQFELSACRLNGAVHGILPACGPLVWPDVFGYAQGSI